MGGKCLSGEYAHCQIKMEFECKEGHKWLASPAHVKEGSWCPICNKGGSYKNRTSKLDKIKLLKNLQNKMIEHGFTLLDDIYISTRHKYSVECSNNHTIRLRACDRPVCKICNKNNHRFAELQNCKDIAKSNDGECLSIEYIGIQVKMSWKCKNKHKWNAAFNHIKNGVWCPYCKIYTLDAFNFDRMCA